MFGNTFNALCNNIEIKFKKYVKNIMNIFLIKIIYFFN